MASLMVMYLPTVRTQDEPLDLLKQAKECLEAQQVDKGLALISKAIAMNPDFAEAYHLRAREYINIKEFQKAAGDCSRLIALRPDAAEGYMLRGFAYLSLHEPDKAVIDLSKAIEIWPKVVDGYMMRAIAYADLKDFANSTRDCTRAIALSPDMPFLYFTRATSELRLEQYNEAHADLQKVLALEPKRPDAYLLLGFASAGIGSIDSAIVWTEKAATDTATAVAAYRNLGFLYLEKRDTKSAMDCFSQAIELDTSRGRCRAMLGLAAVYDDEHKPEESRMWLERALSVEPSLKMNKDTLSGFDEEILLDAEKKAYHKVLDTTISGERKSTGH
jgi:tetratricopeptide (TPR) repeat protein